MCVNSKLDIKKRVPVLVFLLNFFHLSGLWPRVPKSTKQHLPIFLNLSFLISPCHVHTFVHSLFFLVFARSVKVQKTNSFISFLIVLIRGVSSSGSIRDLVGHHVIKHLLCFLTRGGSRLLQRVLLLINELLSGFTTSLAAIRCCQIKVNLNFLTAHHLETHVLRHLVLNLVGSGRWLYLLPLAE